MMADNVRELRPKTPHTEKIKLGYVDLGQIDLMGRKRSTRTGPISSRRPSATSSNLRNFSREDLEAARRAGEKLHINVLGLATIAQDVTPDLARATIGSVSVLGALHATSAVKAALADRTR